MKPDEWDDLDLDDEGKPKKEEERCPECGSTNIIKRGGEVYCGKCGLVID